MQTMYSFLPALCFKSSVKEDNFSTHVPYEAHMETPTSNAMIDYFKESQGEPRAAALFCPPGFGKTDTVANSARKAGAKYVRCSGKSTPLIRSLIRTFDDKIGQMPNANVTAKELLSAFNEISMSFVICLLEAVIAQAGNLQVIPPC
jgi:hypothetical protein